MTKIASSFGVSRDEQLTLLRAAGAYGVFAQNGVYFGVITSYSIHYTKLYDCISQESCMTQRSKPPFRADHVGSFLRPKMLLDARAQHQQGKLSKAELRKTEDA